MLADLNFIILWWFLIFILGIFSLPVVFVVFKKFWDKGYIFSKIITPVILTYIIFVGGFFKILPFTNLSLFIILSFFALLNFFILKQKNNFSNFKKTIKENYKAFIFQEIIFLLVLVAWSFVRGFASDIEGLEKYMDWGFINSSLRSTFLPPPDMWFSGEIINYYYFGHLLFAVITKLSTISSAITYNLAIATVCALTFTFSFSIASNLVFLAFKKIDFKKIITVGLISALLLTFGGNLHSIYKIAQIDIKNNHGKLVLNQEAITKAVDGYWYPDATRFIGYDPDVNDKTIHEFPVYSFVVADLHGHMNDIPIILFFMAFLLASSFNMSTLAIFSLIIISGFNLSIAYMTNAWDFAIYGLFFAIFTAFLNLKNNPKTAIKKTFTNGILTIFCWFIFSLPFSLNFIPMGEGIKIADSHSPFYQLFILYGGFWLIVLPFVILLIKKFNFKIKDYSNTDIFALSIILVATVLIIIPELIYLKDIYIYEHRRANTMFKLVYQSFIMYALISGFVFYRTRSLLKSKWLNFLYGIIFVAIFSIHLIYPYFAIRSFYDSFKNYQGLWGLNYLKERYPDNFIAINWINKNISGQPVMLEAVGDSYTQLNQVSVCTGLPTVEGWVVHEWLWRGGYDKPKQRQDDVQAIYESQSAKELKRLVQKYSVKYIFVGDNEYENYKNINESNFKNIGGEIIFQSGKTKIYQL